MSFINHDGSVHTARWIGVQNPGDARANLTPPLVLNEPSAATSPTACSTSPTATAAPPRTSRAWRSSASSTCRPAPRPARSGSRSRPWFNDIEVADDGTIYATQTGVGGDNADPTTWQVWKITPDGTASIFIQGAPLRQPNGIAFDPQGNIVVVNIGNNEVLTFSPDGKLLKTENAAQAGNDGLVIMPDGTKYVSSVQNGGVSRIRPGPAGGADRAEHPERRVDVLRRRREPAGDPDERQQRAGVRAARLERGGAWCEAGVSTRPDARV